MIKDTLLEMGSGKTEKIPGSIDIVEKENDDAITSPKVSDPSRRTMLKTTLGAV